MAELSAEPDGHRLDELLGRLRVHPVLTAHPTEARRRAVATALRRIGALLDALDDERGRARPSAPRSRRRLREEIDLLWRTAPLRVKPIGPLDEVRTVMAVFDETLFRLAPVIYRALDDALPRPARRRPAARRWLPRSCASAAGWARDRDGNPLVTAQVTREAAVIQADHALRALENATSRIGRALTVHAEAAPPGAGARARPGGRRDATTPSCWPGLAERSPQEPYRTYLLYLARRLRGDPPAPGRPGLPRPARIPGRPAARAGRPGRGRCAPARRSASCST